MQEMDPFVYPAGNINRVVGWPARLWFWLRGWRIEGEPPDLRQYVLLAAPHTSNWDFSYAMGLMCKRGVKIRWFAKLELFPWPFGKLHMWLGGIPVDRSRRNNLVDQMVEAYDRLDDLIVLIPAEASRGLREYWKSGFYYIAQGAGVPIVMGYMDYAQKRLGFGPVLHPTGNLRADMDQIRAFYSDKVGKFPEKVTPPRLRQEVADE